MQHNNQKSSHSQSVDEVLIRFDVQSERGFSRCQVAQRLRDFGPNKLRKAEHRSVWRILVDQFKSVVLFILARASLLVFAFGRRPEGVAILAVLGVNGAIGFISE